MQLNDYQQFIATSRYARWLDDEGRRETWAETVERYTNFWYKKGLIESGEADELYKAIFNLEVMPSMRCMMTAGDALDRDNVAGYNCSYLAMQGQGPTLRVLTDEMREVGFDTPVTIKAEHPICFDEAMYVLLCGTGVGFSVERQFISTLPVVGHKLPRGIYARNDDNFPGVDKDSLSTFDRSRCTIHVADTKYGWASALRILLVELYNGNFEVKWNVDKIRAKGERLKTFGGRASGPEPLVRLFVFAKELFKGAEGRKLTSIEAHDLACMVADIVVVGGVRRSALISLSNLTDERMRSAKTGAWWEANGQRKLANNSVCYTETPDMGIFLREWESLYDSKSGERGIFSRPAAQRVAARNGRRDSRHDFGTNPCSEIILRSFQFCNLSEVIVRPDDTVEDLKRKGRIAAVLGTLQSTLTDFKYLNPKWAENTAEERLLGVSMTGIMDNDLTSGQFGVDGLDEVLEELRDDVVETNALWADRLGIPRSVATTCVKPSGTVSQLVGCSSGIHPSYSPYYIRTVRIDKKDPMMEFLRDQGVEVEDDLMNVEGAVISFPTRAPEDAVVRDEVGAIQQLELWKIYAEHWCEHKPSITVYVREDEWLEVGSWVYKHFDIVSGVSFLPYSDHTYQQAPYQPITEEAYNELIAAFPSDIDWSKLSDYETEDTTSVEHELACSAGGCELT